MTLLLTFLRGLDPKLVSAIVVLSLTRAVLSIGGDPVGDPLWNSVIALVAGAVVGWLWPNDGSVLRAEQGSGNPPDPELVTFRADDTGTPRADFRGW